MQGRSSTENAEIERSFFPFLQLLVSELTRVSTSQSESFYHQFIAIIRRMRLKYQDFSKRTKFGFFEKMDVFSK